VRASIIVVTHSGAERLDDGLASLTPYADRSDVETILVDNGAPDELSEQAGRRFPWARVVRSPNNLGFSGGVNLGAEAASGEVLILLNDDAAAEPGFVEAHLEVLEASPDAAASGGRLVSWDRSRHDFLRGRVTFDVHAFQIGQGWPVDEVEGPAAGEPLPFACGGNAAVRRADWRAVGGFDPGLFAYFEDVELGWQLWSTGRAVVAAPDAVARHRGAATSAALGDFRRGVLFERNALRIFHCCADDEHRAALGSAVYATFLHRMVAFAAARPEWAPHVTDPFGSTVGPAGWRDRWGTRLRDQGVVAAARHLLARVLLGPRAGTPRIDDGHLLMQLRAAHGFFEGIGNTETRRVEVQRRRTVADRELAVRFPRLVVPTYEGDREWFGSDAFRSLLPDDWPIEFADLDDILHPTLRR
jgi:GT2 family glycosyltransferase